MMNFFQMNKIVYSLLFTLTACAPAPVTPFELEIQEGKWDHVYHAIEYIKAGQREKTMTNPTDSIDSALADFWSQKNPIELEE